MFPIWSLPCLSKNSWIGLVLELNSKLEHQLTLGWWSQVLHNLFPQQDRAFMQMVLELLLPDGPQHTTFAWRHHYFYAQYSNTPANKVKENEWIFSSMLQSWNLYPSIQRGSTWLNRNMRGEKKTTTLKDMHNLTTKGALGYPRNSGTKTLRDWSIWTRLAGMTS